MSQGKISSLNFRGRGKGTVVTHEKREKNKLIKRVRTTTSPRIKNTIEKRNSSSSINAKRGKESERGKQSTRAMLVPTASGSASAVELASAFRPLAPHAKRNKWRERNSQEHVNKGKGESGKRRNGGKEAARL